MRVAITGIGLVSACGLRPAEHVEAAVGGGGVAVPARAWREDGVPCTAGVAPDFDIGPLLRIPKNQKFMSRQVRFAVYAAIQAVRASSLPLEGFDRTRLGVYTGSGQTGLEYQEFFPALFAAWTSGREMDYKHLGGRASRLIDPYFSLRTLSNSGVGLLSAELAAQGASGNFVHSETASVSALNAACWDLAEGRCDAAVAGGYDSLVNPSVLLAYSGAGLISRSGRCRPFDAGRDGLVPSEGAAFFVLERVEDAASRGASAWGEILGVGDGGETTPAGRPLCSAACLGAAIERAEPAAIDFVVAHGIGLPEDDAREAAAIREILGNKIPVTAFKGLTGYAGAATGTLEIALGLLCAGRGVLPRIAGLESPGPECNLSFVYPECGAVSVPATGLFLSYSWGGQHGVILARCLPTPAPVASEVASETGSLVA
ncbi:MAG: beta-ketoacyl synthase [Bryobacteraceae bacterium]